MLCVSNKYPKGRYFVTCVRKLIYLFEKMYTSDDFVLLKMVHFDLAQSVFGDVLHNNLGRGTHNQVEIGVNLESTVKSMSISFFHNKYANPY